MTITLNGTTGIITPAVQAEGVTTNIYPIVSGTAVASTSGTSIDFTSIPTWVKRITMMFQGVSTNSTSPVIVQLGAGSIDATSYLTVTGLVITTANTTRGYSPTTGFSLYGNSSGAAAATLSGSAIFSSFTSNTWVVQGCISAGADSSVSFVGGYKTLSGTLDRVRLTTVNGTDTFDLGSINILYE
jgi:hypothetical protein